MLPSFQNAEMPRVMIFCVDLWPSPSPKALRHPQDCQGAQSCIKAPLSSRPGPVRVLWRVNRMKSQNVRTGCFQGSPDTKKSFLLSLDKAALETRGAPRLLPPRLMHEIQNSHRKLGHARNTVGKLLLQKSCATGHTHAASVQGRFCQTQQAFPCLPGQAGHDNLDIEVEIDVRCLHNSRKSINKASQSQNA